MISIQLQRNCQNLLLLPTIKKSKLDKCHLDLEYHLVSNIYIFCVPTITSSGLFVIRYIWRFEMQACLFGKEEFSIFSRTSSSSSDGGAICLLYLCVIAACQNLEEKGLKYQ